MTFLIWAGIFACLTQSGMLSGLNLGLFSVGKLELEVEAKKGNAGARRVRELREDANFALVTILWGNVGVNVLLALLSGSVMGGVAAFLFSTVIITIFAEILPQSYFTRNALRMAALLAPVLRVYQAALYPVARPTAWVLDQWLGGEEIRFFRERDLRRVIELHMEAADSEIARVEGQGALNFLELDDVPMDDEGEPVDPESVIPLEFDGTRPRFPKIGSTPEDPFLRKISRTDKSWVVIVDGTDEPRLVLQTAGFLREALFGKGNFNPHRHCHRPIIARDPKARLGDLIPRYRAREGNAGEEDIVEYDVILLWNGTRRVVTGTDVLGRLLRGIARPPAASARADASRSAAG